MSLQTMPCDILFGILQHISSLKYDAMYFKYSLKLLGIFQRLRAVALTKIYNYVYISASKFKSRNSQNHANKYRNIFAKYVDTNADIIALANCTHMVKTVKILVFKLNTTYTEIQNIIEALKSCAAIWPNVTKLKIVICYYNWYSKPGKVLSMQLCHMSKEYSRELVNVMPSVTGLTFKSNNHSFIANELYIHITGEYANKLVSLTNEHDFNRAVSHKFKVLQNLNISMSRSEVLPRVNSQTLVDLHIKYIPFNVLWAPFMDSNDGDVIEFLCLKKLWLEFRIYEATEHTDANMPELLLKFPELRSLTIFCDSEVCLFFKMARFPNVMDNIHIDAPPTVLAHLYNTGIPTAKIRINTVPPQTVLPFFRNE